MILQVGGERYPRPKYLYGGAWAWNFGGGLAVTGALLCGSISVEPLLVGTCSVSPLLLGAVTVTPTLTGDVTISEC